jgi:hypothetical protein
MLNKKRVVVVLVVGVIVLLSGGRVLSTQIDYTGDDWISDQEWMHSMTLPPPDDADSFYVRFPYPDYCMYGRWATYCTGSIEIDISCDEPGPFYCEFTHYNKGYSNQGVWIKVSYPPGPIKFDYRVVQSVSMELPGLGYDMDHYTNNGWMAGTEVVDCYNYPVAEVLSEAKSMSGDWLVRGYWREPEQIVNWMNQNMTWKDDNRYQPWSASYILEQGVREGNCDEWAHATCALLLKAGIPARVVLVGTTTSYNDTNKWFEPPSKHLCVSYWDGFGWIMIDPKESSGFAFISRVVLGADQDSKGVRIRTHPLELIYEMTDASCSCDEGNQSGHLTEECYRCSSYPWEILAHYELTDSQTTTGTEPKNCIVPNDVVSVREEVPASGSMFFANYPNPFNPVTTFRFNIRREGRVSIRVYSVEGRYVETVVDRYMSRGEKEVEWKAAGLASGLYFARMRSPGCVCTRKVVILR